MDYKSSSALYLCAEDSEEMPGFDDMNLLRNSEFPFNNSYATEDNSLCFTSNRDAIKSEKSEQKSLDMSREENIKPYVYASVTEDSKPIKEDTVSKDISVDQSTTNPCNLNLMNQINNDGVTNFDDYGYSMHHSKQFQSRVNEYDRKDFMHDYQVEALFSDKANSQGLYDGDTEEEDDSKNQKNDNSELPLDDDKMSEGNDADDDNDEDDETDVEKQNHDDEDDNNSNFNDQQTLEAEQQPESAEASASSEKGTTGEKPKKSKSDSKRSNGDTSTKVRKKRKRRNSGEPSEKKHKTENSRKNNFERKNIRKIFEEENLDEETKAAQKEEMERKQRLLEIQEKLKQQALELRAQREKEMANHTEQFFKREPGSSSLKSLLEDKGDAADLANLLDPGKLQVCKPKVTDVVEISSSEEENEDDDDDDLIVMSDVEEEEPDDGEEDAENSGSHVNDAVNRPDANGCVLVNVGHPLDEPEIFLAPQLASAVKPHQIGGIRFMYDNIVESLDRYKTSNGFGCILAHSMGLGKTIQVVSFVDIFLRHTGAKSVLIIVPVNTLQNWINEFNMWLPMVEEGSQMGGAGIDREILWPREFKLYVINDNMKTTNSRTKIVAEWHSTGGVLLLGYEMYRLLIKTRGVPVKSRRASKKANSEPVVIDVEEEEVNKEIVKNLHEALMRPGPDLVICDEGHRIKNSHASISQVLKNIRTRRRVVLTGYPLQNNLLEYWCMVDFVRPNYLGTKQEFCNMFERPIMNGQCADSTAKDVKLMRYRAHVLHSLLEGFVQRRGHAVLQATLPQKEEYVIFVRLSPIQRKLYNEFMTAIKDSGNIASWSNSNNPIKAFSVCCKIWNHPDILYQVVEQRKDDNDLDLDEGKVTNGEMVPTNNNNGVPSANHKRAYKRAPKQSAPVPPAMGNPGSTCEGEAKVDDADGSAKEAGTATTALPPISEKKESQVISYEWAMDIMKDYMAGLVEHSGKMAILLDIIDECVNFGDKLLVFSQSLYTLTLIEDYLSRRRVPGFDEFWQKNKNYFRLDGGTAGIDREKLINQFNDVNNNRVHLFLLSTRAGCLGINLIGACRVVIFDASWNPCHDCQAVCRVYRYGQCKSCYVYRLVSDNTMEKNIYDRQINKQGISDRVVDELNPQNLLSKKQVDVLMRNDATDAPEINLDDYREKCTDQLLVRVIKRNGSWLSREPFTHESLLLDRKDQKLTRHEKRMAKQGYEMDKKMSTMGFSRQSSLYAKTMDGSGIIRFGQRPVASVRPMMSSPLKNGPGGPRIVANQFRAPGLKPGVSVQQIQTTTDIIIPGTNTVSDSTGSKIPAGEKVLVIKTPKGVYIRTSQGKIFAVRTAPKSSAGTSPTTASLASSSSTSTAATTTTSSQLGSITSTGKISEQMEVIDDDEEDDNNGESSNEKSNPSEQPMAGSSDVPFETAKNSKSAGATGVASFGATSSEASGPHDRPVASHQSSSSSSSSSAAAFHFNHSSSSDAHSAAVPTFASSRDFASPSVSSAASSKSVGAPTPIKPILPMQQNNSNSSRQTKRSRDKPDNSPSGGVSHGNSSSDAQGPVVPINPQPFSKPIAQPQPMANTTIQMNQQNSLFDWNKKPSFESSSLFGLQPQDHPGHLNSPDAGMGDLFTNYLKGGSGAGLHPPFFNRSMSSSLSSSSSMTHPSSSSSSSSAQNSNKTFNLSSPTDRGNNGSSSSGKCLPGMMGPSSNLHHPVPMTPPSYLPHGVNPYGMPNPYSWMPSPMWMGASPMDVAHPPPPPPHFSSDPSAYGSSSAPEDFGHLGHLGQGSNDLLALDGFGGFSNSFDDRSFSSLLMGDEDAASQGGSRRMNSRPSLSANPSYRQNPMGYPPPPPAPMSAYPYHNPYAPYAMPPPQPGSYYGAPGSTHSPSGGAMVGRGSYIPPSMHYPQHGGFVQTSYDFGGPSSRNLMQGPPSSSSSSSSSKKNFDAMKGE